MELNKGFWNARYETDETGWDLGGTSAPLKAYFDQLTNKSLNILIPGCGNGYDAAYLHEIGFNNTHLLDFSTIAIGNCVGDFKNIPSKNFHCEDFFAHNRKYDLIVEQTFFCAIDRELRSNYVNKMHDLLKPSGKLVGVLFNEDSNEELPPFGADIKIYRGLFEPVFNLLTLAPCYNSIEPRMDRELFVIAQRN